SNGGCACAPASPSRGSAPPGAMCCSRRKWARTPRRATWRASSSASRRRRWRSTPRDPRHPGDGSRHPRVLSRAQLVLRAAARALDPGDLGADAAGRGRGLPAPDAARRTPAPHAHAAIQPSRFPPGIAGDADPLIEPDALLRLPRPVLLSSRIAAGGGTVRVANGCTVGDGRVSDARVPRRFLPGIQVVEYLRAFLFGRLGWNRLGGSLVISGAFGLFRKEYLHAIGGYRVASVVEDLDLVVRLHR